MRVWIIGAGGQIGGALIRCCKERDISFIGTRHADLDVTKEKEVEVCIDKVAPTHIVNAAGYTSVDRAEQEAGLAYAVNVDGAGHIAKAAAKRGVPLLHLSTDYVFDGHKQNPYHEEDAPNPLGVYSRTKWEGEKRVLEYCSHACILRVSWVFGSQGRNFISMLLPKLQQEEEFVLFSNERSSPTCCSDLTSTILEMLEASGTFHFSNRGGFSRFEIAHLMWNEAKALGVKMRCREIIDRSSSQSPFTIRPVYSELSTEKISRYLKKEPRDSKTALKEYIQQWAAIKDY